MTIKKLTKASRWYFRDPYINYVFTVYACIVYVYYSNFELNQLDTTFQLSETFKLSKPMYLSVNHKKKDCWSFRIAGWRF